MIDVVFLFVPLLRPNVKKKKKNSAAIVLVNFIGGHVCMAAVKILQYLDVNLKIYTPDSPYPCWNK